MTKFHRCSRCTFMVSCWLAVTKFSNCVEGKEKDKDKGEGERVNNVIVLTHQSQ